MRWQRYVPGTLVLCCGLLAMALAVREATPVKAASTWNPSAAARYMDARQTWWMNWPKSHRDHETVCVSCHTVLPYALGRASLRQTMRVPGEAGPEQMMLAFVHKRVDGWAEMQPFYGEKSGPRKSVESRVTEAVLNALVLARYDSLTGAMSPETKTAFDHMWETQLKEGDGAGAWEWLNFHNAPWEGETSAYYGATLAALAVRFTPESYRHSAEAQPHIAALDAYLERHYEAQPLINKVLMVWSSDGARARMTAERRDALLAEIARAQGADGGWSIAAMGPWKRQDGTAIDTHEDAYATALCVLALRAEGRTARDAEVQRGVAWLVANQDAEGGMWIAASLNKQRAPGSDAALFMTDAATGYAVLALDEVRSPRGLRSR